MGISARHAPALDLPARFMALAITSFLIWSLTAPFTLPLTQGYFNDFKMLALVHLFTLGFVGSMMIGAGYQLTPVVLQTELASVRAGRISFWFYAFGLAMFIGGLTSEWLPGLAIGGTSLGVAFLLYCGTVFATWRRASNREVVGWYIVMGLAGSLMGMSMGVGLAFNKGNGMLGAGLLGFLGAHIAFMLGGWIAIMFMGVSYRLICMFTLSEKYFRPWLAWITLVLVAGGSWVLATALHLEWSTWWLQGSTVAILVGFICFAVQIQRLYARRIRRVIDVHMPFALVSVVWLIAVPILALIGFRRGALPNDPIWVAVVWLALPGAIGTAIQGFFYKIATFLVWLKRYAPQAGKSKVPKLDEMYNRNLALTGFGIWTISIAGGAICLLLDVEAMWLTGIGIAIGGICFLGNVMLITRHWWRGPALQVREPVISRQPHLRSR